MLLATWFLVCFFKRFRSFNAKNLRSVGQRAAKLLAFKVGLLKKKSAALAIPAEVCGSAFGLSSSLPKVKSSSNSRVNISSHFLDQDRERFWILGVLGKGFLWHKWKFVNSLILLMHFICKKGKNLEIHPSFGYSWANYEKSKENFDKKCLVLPFWLGKSFWWCRERFHFLGRYIYPCELCSRSPRNMNSVLSVFWKI